MHLPSEMWKVHQGLIVPHCQEGYKLNNTDCRHYIHGYTSITYQADNGTSGNTGKICSLVQADITLLHLQIFVVNTNDTPYRISLAIKHVAQYAGRMKLKRLGNLTTYRFDQIRQRFRVAFYKTFTPLCHVLKLCTSVQG